jgi:hypothetical protein
VSKSVASTSFATPALRSSIAKAAESEKRFIHVIYLRFFF